MAHCANENNPREKRHGWCETGAGGAVAILTLDEPASLNAMTPDLLGALAVAVGEMTQDEGVVR
jgi:enoyl-CoA hydratase/carnithine racemase